MTREDNGHVEFNNILVLFSFSLFFQFWKCRNFKFIYFQKLLEFIFGLKSD